MRTHDPEGETASSHRRDLLRWGAVAVVAVAAALSVSIYFLRPAPPRNIVMASGAPDGIYHRYAQRYAEILARDGVKVELRPTNGAFDNLKLLLDPNSGVDVAFLQGGVASSAEASDLVMLASLYYEPLWIFYRGPDTLTQIDELRGKRIGVGVPGSGTLALVDQLLAINDVSHGDSRIVAIGGKEALAALKNGSLDALFYVGGADTPTIQTALRDPAIKLMSMARADAYQRRISFLTKLTLPQGTIDLARNIPSQDVTLVATKAMLASREDFHPAVINLLLDAAREIHGDQGYFEAADEFPGIAPVDLPVSQDAIRHVRFGPNFLHRYLPFSLANFIERAIVLLLPMLIVAIPLLSYIPPLLRWRYRSRIYRWYGELAFLEQDVAARAGAPLTEKWLEQLERIVREAEALKIRTPPSFAAEAYTLRNHAEVLRRKILRKSRGDESTPLEEM